MIIEQRPMKNYTVRMDIEVIDMAKRRAKAVGTTFSAYFREALESFSGATDGEIMERIERRQEQAQILNRLTREVAVLDDACEIFENVKKGFERRKETA